MSAISMMVQTCTIKRRSGTNPSTTTGGQAGTWGTTVASGVRCNVQTSNDGGDELTLGSRPTGVVYYDVYLPWGTDIRADDRIDTISGLTGVTLVVTSPPMDDVGRQAYFRVKAEHRNGGGMPL